MHNAYEIITEKEVKDLNSKGYLLKHKKTGARIFILSNDDENKVFYIGFRTPPYNSTGLPHILEHSVLCGSDKYPVKDPFVELCKGSLNTFLNAMTYPDKTVYPVASCNDQDFKNLMDVYMDAVLHPNIYKHDEIFRQEGWRYELEDVDSEIKINGVVYNEMKGAFSTPDDMMDREIFNTLFPDTPYGVESGGDPDVIPELSYEEFLDFHGKYYHPSNSYIYMYGNMDIDERLEYLDREYLSKYEAIDIDSTIVMQKPFDKTYMLTKQFSVTNEEPTDKNTYLSYNVVVDTALNRELYVAFQVIDYCLIGAPGAILTERLLKSGIVSDIDAVYENGILQPYYSIIGKGADKKDLDAFISEIKDELNNAVSNGLNKDMIRAAINIFEFKYREADFGRYPKGLMYGLQAFDSWLYDDKDPFMHIEANDTFAFLKKQVDTDYFEQIINKYLLNNNHSSIVVLEPERGLNAKKDKALADKLSEYKKSLSEEQIN
ncbi:MAG: insulinase family protein, partial [Lachnospiraceae bacterium]|nr:insulinase family protein [Lachnospiraceae bacterium]